MSIEDDIKYDELKKDWIAFKALAEQVERDTNELNNLCQRLDGSSMFVSKASESEKELFTQTKQKWSDKKTTTNPMVEELP